jgi:hypothetical protein
LVIIVRTSRKDNTAYVFEYSTIRSHGFDPVCTVLSKKGVNRELEVDGLCGNDQGCKKAGVEKENILECKDLRRKDLSQTV